LFFLALSPPALTPSPPVSGSKKPSKKKKNGSGVSYNRASRKWTASGPRINGSRAWLGAHDTELEAFQAVCAHLREIGMLE
jgi:hypothetical protein